MTIWLDNHLSPAVAAWIGEAFGLTCIQIRDRGLARADDRAIFSAARDAGAVFITKDSDFAELVGRLGPPPSIVWLRFGNTSSAELKRILSTALPAALAILGEQPGLVEIVSA